MCVCGRERKSEVVGVKGSRPDRQRECVLRVSVRWQSLPARVGLCIFEGPEQRIRRHSRPAFEEKLCNDYRAGAGSEAALFRGRKL